MESLTSATIVIGHLRHQDNSNQDNSNQDNDKEESDVRVLVVGAGSTGGFFGGKLAQAGRDVTFLVRPRRAAELKASGLQILSPSGDFTFAPKLLTSDAISEPFDLIILAVKSYSFAGVIADIGAAVGPRTMILPLLNGMAHVKSIVERYGPAALVGGLCKVNTLLDDEGRVIHNSIYCDLVYGEMDGSRSERIVALDRLLQNAGFTATLSLSIEREMWEKWVMIASLGGINTLTRANVGEIANTLGGYEFVNQFIAELSGIVSALGHPPSVEFIENISRSLTSKDSQLTSSMYRDFQANLPVEADQIFGDLLAHAKQHDLPAPLLTAAYLVLSIYQRLRDEIAGKI